MRLDKACKLAISLPSLFQGGDVDPYAYSWVDIADGVPIALQGIPAKWEVLKNATRQTVKYRVFISTASFFAVFGAIEVGQQGAQGIWLFEVYESDMISKAAFIGNPISIWERYMVFEVGEYYGSTVRAV